MSDIKKNWLGKVRERLSSDIGSFSLFCMCAT
nr:MAG TPA: hypothetical protein [Bacteriophage sp.]